MSEEEFINKIKDIKVNVPDEYFFLEYNKCVYDIMEQNEQLKKENDYLEERLRHLLISDTISLFDLKTNGKYKYDIYKFDTCFPMILHARRNGKNSFIDKCLNIELVIIENKQLKEELEQCKAVADTNKELADSYYNDIQNAIKYVKEHQRQVEFLNLNEWQTRDLLEILGSD